MRKTYSIENILIVILLLVIPCLGYCQTQDSLSLSPKSSQVNPFKNLKFSAFTQGGTGSFLGGSYSGGIELRRFISLKKYIFLDVMYGSWSKSESKIINSYGEYCSYKLNCETVGAKVGLGIFGTQTFNAGVHYLLSAHLAETIPSILNSDVNIIVRGDITNYTKHLIPFVGYNMKYKLWKFFFIELGAEVWFRQNSAFKPLKNNWRVPDVKSPFLTKPPTSGLYGYLAIHLKL